MTERSMRVAGSAYDHPPLTNQLWHTPLPPSGRGRAAICIPTTSASFVRALPSQRRQDEGCYEDRGRVGVVAPDQGSHITMQGVSEAAVIGAKDDKWGERPLALIVRDVRTGEDPGEILVKAHLASFADARFISKYPIPDEILLVGALPKTSVGRPCRSVRTVGPSWWTVSPPMRFRDQCWGPGAGPVAPIGREGGKGHGKNRPAGSSAATAPPALMSRPAWVRGIGRKGLAPVVSQCSSEARHSRAQPSDSRPAIPNGFGIPAATGRICA